MKNAFTSESEENNNNVTKHDEESSQAVITDELTKDPDYVKLIDHYQKAEFELCKMVIKKLEERFPEHPELLKIRDDLQMKSSVKSLTVNIKKGEKREKRKATFNLSLFAIIGTVLVMIAFSFSYNYLQSRVTVEPTAQVTSQLSPLNNQAEQLLNLGRPQPALEIIEKMRLIDPEYENLPGLTLRVEELLQLEVEYQEGLDLVAEDKNSEALAVFNEIESEKPGLWDVKQQIALIENTLEIAESLEEGNKAFMAENWRQVISAYENALSLDPKLDEPLIKEQLFLGYLNRIISMLQNEDTSIEEIEQAEGYYRKAVAMFPQSKDFTSEKINLQELSSDLLVLKFSEMADAKLDDKKQTAATIAQASSYIRKAANLKPKNTLLQQELRNVEYYQVAFQHFIDMEWESAIENLEEIVSTDKNYANGNARVLLFESYYALGKQYYSAGLYQDARKNLEQAEIIAWDDKDNLLKLFQVQLFLGDTLGKMDDYENAISYYKYALEAIQFLPRLMNYPLATSIYSEANIYAGNGNFEDAYKAYKELFMNIDFIYTTSEIEIDDRVCLALFADENQSTVDAIIETNNLSKSMVITFGRQLKVPTIGK